MNARRYCVCSGELAEGTASVPTSTDYLFSCGQRPILPRACSVVARCPSPASTLQICGSVLAHCSTCLSLLQSNVGRGWSGPRSAPSELAVPSTDARAPLRACLLASRCGRRGLADDHRLHNARRRHTHTHTRTRTRSVASSTTVRFSRVAVGTGDQNSKSRTTQVKHRAASRGKPKRIRSIT